MTSKKGLDTPLCDIFEHVASAQKRDISQPAGTIVASDGTLVTL